MEGVAQIVALADAQLIDALTALATSERKGIALLVAGLAEFDKRGLHLGLGYSSLFDYCTRGLHLSEPAAYSRIAAARASRRFPAIIDHIADANLSLTATRLLAPHLTAENFEELVDKAARKKTRDVEKLVATIRPQPAVPSVVRKLPDLAGEISAAAPAMLSRQPSPAARPVPPPVATPPTRRPILKPLSATQYRLQITLSASAHDKLREAQRLMRHAVPNGDPAAIVERALDLLLTQARKTKFGETSRPRQQSAAMPRGRHIPKAIKRQVWKRDAARCAFVGADGSRCAETNFLEFHHVKPYARGGATTPENLELRCRAHNAYEAGLLGL